MRRTSLWGLLLCAGIASSCTSVTFTDLSIQQLHEKIAAGEIVRPGETATITTVDGEQHELKVSAISVNSVTGKEAASRSGNEDGFEQAHSVSFIDVTIPIDTIQSVEKTSVTHPAGQAAVATGFGAVYIFLLMLPATIVAAMAL